MGAVVDRHVVLLDERQRGEVGEANGTRGVRGAVRWLGTVGLPRDRGTVSLSLVAGSGPVATRVRHRVSALESLPWADHLAVLWRGATAPAR